MQINHNSLFSLKLTFGKLVQYVTSMSQAQTQVKFGSNILFMNTGSVRNAFTYFFPHNNKYTSELN